MIRPKIPQDVLRGHRATLGPSWRDRLGATRTPRAGRRFDPIDDPWIAKLQEYSVLLIEQGADVAATEFPEIWNANNLELAPERRDMAKIMVVGDLPVAEAAERIKISVATLRAWEEIFFDVRVRRGEFIWLQNQVIDAEARAGNAPLAARLRLAALCGPAGARAILDCDTAPLDEAERLFQQRLNLYLKTDQALQMPIESERQAFRLIKFQARNVIAKQRWELKVRRLEERCTAARERHERERLRLQLAIERQAAAKTVRRANRRKVNGSGHVPSRDEMRWAACYHNAARAACDVRAAACPLAGLRWAAKPEPETAADRKCRKRKRPERVVAFGWSGLPIPGRLKGRRHIEVQRRVGRRRRTAATTALAVTT